MVDVRAASPKWDVHGKHSSKARQPQGPTTKSFNEHGAGDRSKPVENLKAAVLPRFKLDFKPKLCVLDAFFIRTIPVLGKKKLVNGIEVVSGKGYGTNCWVADVMPTEDRIVDSCNQQSSFGTVSNVIKRWEADSYIVGGD